MNTITIHRCSKYLTALLPFLFSLSTQGVSYTTDTINSSQIFRDNVTTSNTLISSGGSFEFGFFSPENSNNRYVGIWYKNIPRTVEWVGDETSHKSQVPSIGNRDNLVKDGSGMLRVTESGQLLLNGTNGIVWSTNATRIVQNPVAQLLNSGNLVLKEANDDNPENFLWQSFNYPTDTLLPRMKLGWNFITGLEVYMSSWKNSGNPAAGDFTFHLDSTDYPQLVIRKDTQYSWSNKSMTLEECKVVCSKNCSCMAYTSLNISRGEKGCLLWFGELVDIRKLSPGQDIYIRVASSELDSGGRKQKILIVMLFLVVGIVLLSLTLLLYFKKRNLDHQLQETGRPEFNAVSHEDLELPLFHLSTITKATNNFSIDNKLGEGGFGPVFNGLLEDGQEITVKCLSRTSLQGVDELKNEVICIAKLQHRNLVKLLGWCIQGEEMMLVYEYMPNKSLDLILFDQVKSASLDSHRRFNIINNIARGLLYLHQDSRLRVIHRELKASNILLDSDMKPKISDFGIARTFGGNETSVNTSRVVGTLGYMSPEYATYGLFSVKSDVFSFGVLVLEIVAGKRKRGFSYRDHHLNLLGYAWILYREGRTMEMVDSSLQNSCNLRSIYVGLICVQECPEDRPSMTSVVQMFGSDSVLPEAKRPGFFTGIDILRAETPVILDTSSTNEMSITVLEAR
ncbi:hypothetical protein ACS0TY_017083 [Phlomoides rotata]